MGRHIPDKERAEIVAEYLELGNYNAVARLHNTTCVTVKRIVLDADIDLKAHFEKQHEKNKADILAHMETKKDKVNEIIDLYLEMLLNPKNFDKVTPNQLTTALGTLIDKFTMQKMPTSSQETGHNKLMEAIKSRNENRDAVGETETSS